MAGGQLPASKSNSEWVSYSYKIHFLSLKILLLNAEIISSEKTFEVFAVRLLPSKYLLEKIFK